MIQSLKQIKNRIRGIGNTRKVTAAMEMVSVSKLNRTEKQLLCLRPFVSGFEKIMRNLISSHPQAKHSLLEARGPQDKPCLCVITSDSGLCGVYNNNIIRTAEAFIQSQAQEKIELICVGRRGFGYFKKNNLKILNTYIGLNGRYSGQVAETISANLLDLFISGEASGVYVAYTHFKTALIHEPKVEKLLNIERISGAKTEYILEPDLQTLLNDMLPKYITMKFKMILLEAFTAEHSARTVAMKTATDNAKELLEGLILLRNKVRQANITQEIMEVISSSEALKG